jgi:endonuclease/exonuclease/phosphatase family metal-dependent hydrolase
MNISILQLNIWNGQSDHFEIEFIKLMDKKPDIVCLQECTDSYTAPGRSDRGVRNNCERFLREQYWSDYEIFYSPRQTTCVVGKYTDKSDMAHWGNIILWKRSKLTMIESASRFIRGTHDSYDYTNDQSIPVNVQSLVLSVLEFPETKFLVCNIHGWYGGKGFGKSDSDERLQQSQDLIKIIELYGDIPVVLCGDFNLRLDTQSLTLLERSINSKGNAIKNFSIISARTPLYGEEKRKKEPHASYIITSKEFEQKNCIVDSESLVSDHAPIWLDTVI